MEERLVIKSMQEAVQNIDFIMDNPCQGERYEASKLQKLRDIQELLKKSPNGIEIRRFTPFEKVEEKKPYEPPRLEEMDAVTAEKIRAAAELARKRKPHPIVFRSPEELTAFMNSIPPVYCGPRRGGLVAGLADELEGE